MPTVTMQASFMIFKIYIYMYRQVYTFVQVYTLNKLQFDIDVMTCYTSIN